MNFHPRGKINLTINVSLSSDEILADIFMSLEII